MNENRSFGNSSDMGENVKMPAEIPTEMLTVAPSQTSVRKRFSVLGFGLAIYTAVSLTVVALIIQIVAMIIDPNVINNTVFLNIVSSVALYIFALPCLLGVIYLFKLPSEAPERRKIGVLPLVLIFVVSFGFMYIGSYVGQGVMWGFSKIVGYDYSNMLESMIDYDYMWVTFIFMCVVAPIGEEFVFRKLIIDRTHKYGGLVSILFSGLAFGLMHGNFYQFFYAFALGLVLGYLYYRTGNVWYTVAIHAGINFIGSIVTSYLALGTDRMSIAIEKLDVENIDAVMAFWGEYWFVLLAFIVFFAFMVISMICAIVLPIVFRKKIVIEGCKPLIARKKALSAAFLNAGVIVMILLYAFQFIINLIPPTIGQ